MWTMPPPCTWDTRPHLQTRHSGLYPRRPERVETQGTWSSRLRLARGVLQGAGRGSGECGLAGRASCPQGPYILSIYHTHLPSPASHMVPNHPPIQALDPTHGAPWPPKPRG